MHIILSSLLFFTLSSVEESNLRDILFTNYNNKVRPVIESTEPINISMGLAVQNLEEFNQMEETIKLNIWLRSNWDDEYLNWNTAQSNLTFLPISDEIWKHDVELMNAAGKPELYLLNGGANLYPSGSIMWSKPAIFKFSCSLDLEKFPFDKQVCSMKFGSWLYSNRYLQLRPYNNVASQIDILDGFSHSEWQFISSDLIVGEEERPCCPNERFDIINYNFTFKRYTHYYKLSMGMTISLVLASFIIMLMEPDNVSRTGTAVFIPLTILALQLTIADKIPVVGYTTLMDSFFLCCFISSMIVSIESGIMFSLITTNSKKMYRVLRRIFNLEKLKNIHFKSKHRELIQIEKNEDIIVPITRRLDQSQIHDKTIDEANNTNNTNNSCNNIDETTPKENTTMLTETVRVIETSLMDNENITSEIITIDDDVDNCSTKSQHSNNSDASVISKDVVKTIDYNDKLLSLTFEEKLMFDELKRIIRRMDNGFRIILPIVFFIYIGIIYSNED